MSDYKPSENTVSLLAFFDKNEGLKNRIKALTPEQLEATEATLEAKCSPTQNDKCLKIAFWQEYKRAQNEGRLMSVTNIYHDVYSQKGWMKKINNPDFLAWLIHPPQNEYLLQLHLIDLGMKRISEALSLDFMEKKTVRSGTNKDGTPRYTTQEKVNVPLIKEIRGIVEMLQNRAYGSVLHRQANVNYEIAGNTQTISLENIEQIEEKIKKMKEIREIAKELNPSRDEEIIDGEEAEGEDDL